jgi:hypothetical protein
MIGAAQLWHPLHSDQALYLSIAKRLSAGDVLYRDIWFDKQPGVLLFYGAAGELFGWDERGIHLLELIWMAGTCGVTLAWAKALSGRPAVQILAPVLTAGAYYAASGAWQLTQIEALVMLPLFVAGGLPAAPGPRPALRLAVAGAAGGIVLAQKITLVPLLAAMWLVPVASAAWTATGPRWRSAARTALLLAAGCMAPLAAEMAWAARYGILRDLLWVTFSFPFEFVASEAREHFYPTFRQAVNLYGGIIWFLASFGPMVLVAALGVSAVVRRKSLYGLVLIVWAGAAVPTILAQTWWVYHFLILLPPIGLLAVAGLDWLVSLPQVGPLRGSAAAGIAVAVVLAVLAVPLLPKLLALSRHGFGEEGRLLYQEELDQNWAFVVRDVQFLRDPRSAPGPIYAYAGPLWWLASGRDPARVPDNTLQLPEQRRHWPEALMRSAPSYIRLPREIRFTFNAIDPDFQAFLDERYRRVEGHPPWYVRADLAPATEDTAEAAGLR